MTIFWKWFISMTPIILRIINNTRKIRNMDDEDDTAAKVDWIDDWHVSSTKQTMDPQRLCPSLGGGTRIDHVAGGYVDLFWLHIWSCTILLTCGREGEISSELVFMLYTLSGDFDDFDYGRTIIEGFEAKRCQWLKPDFEKKNGLNFFSNFSIITAIERNNLPI